MSKIGKKPIALPNGVTLDVSGSVVTAKGPKGELSYTLPAGVTVTVADGQVLVSHAADVRGGNTVWGLARALINNMLIGVSEGFKKVLEFQGVGYKAVPKGNDLELNLGYSHTITVTAPEGITFTVDKNTITISGIDKEKVGHVAALIRSKRTPEPYKGHGIRYADEVIKRKAGKKAATAA